LLDTRAAAAFIGVKYETLLRWREQRWRERRIGPPWVVIGRNCLRYRRAALESWLDRRTRGGKVENLKSRTVDALNAAIEERPAAPVKHGPSIATIHLWESGARCDIAGANENEALANQALVALIEPQIAEIERLVKAAIRWREIQIGGSRE
jgi:hypothetical protein